MEVEPLVADQPPLNHRGLVRRKIVEDDVHFEILRNRLIDLAEEVDEVLGPMLLFRLREDVAGGDVERGEQVERTVTNVVVGLAFRHAEIHGQDWLSSFESLNLRFLIEGEYDCVGWRVHVAPDDVSYLLDELGIVGQLEPPYDVRFEAICAPDAAH
jgi:hypothetical protein